MLFSVIDTLTPRFLRRNFIALLCLWKFVFVVDTSAVSIDQSFTYDALNRLTAAAGAGYSYDAAGNLLGITGPPPTKPNTPSPVSPSSDNGRTLTLGWIAAQNASGLMLYYGTNSNLTGSTQVALTGSSTSYVLPSTLAYNTTIYWRIDAFNGAGQTTTGDVWNFTTLANTAPTVSTITAKSTNEDTTISGITFTLADAESLGTVNMTATSSNTTLVPNANITLGGSGANRTLDIQPAANQNGTTTITVTATDDGGLSDSKQFFLTVLEVNDLPTLTSFSSQTIDEDTATAAIPFTVGDVETPVGSLVVTAASSAASVVPNLPANLVLSGSGANRTLTVLPASNAFGATTITVTVTDGSGGQTARSFLLTANPVNDAPTITQIVNQSILPSTTTGALIFTIDDVETSASSLTVTRSSSNTTLVPTANVVLGGSSSNRTVTVTPVAGQTGSALITITVSDGVSSTPMNFSVIVTNSNLASLALSTGILSPTFTPGVTTYTAAIPNASTSITVTPTVADVNATVTVNSVPVASGSSSAPVAMALGVNAPITIFVTAQDGSTKTYTITPTRNPLPVATTTAASAIGSVTATLNGSVNANGVSTGVVFEYGSTTAYGNTVTASPAIVTGSSPNAVGAILSGLSGETTYHYRVKASNSTDVTPGQDLTFRTLSNNGNLSALVLNTGTLTPAFASSVLNYSATVPHSVTSVSATATTASVLSSLTVNGTTIPSGTAGPSLTLSVGQRVIAIIVTAEDGSTRSYNVTVTRLPDTTAPTVIVSSPTTGSTVTSPLLPISGTASDDGVLQSVTVRVNGGTPTVMSGTNSWSGNVNLALGDNSVLVAATDVTGNSSAPITLQVRYLLPDPEIEVSGAGNVIVSGDTTPSAGDGTDFGTAPLFTSTLRTFTIRNWGAQALSISGTSFTGSSSFVVDSAPSSIPAGGAADFSLRYQAPGSAGTETAVLTLQSNDPDEAAYTFTVRAEAVYGRPCRIALFNDSTFVNPSGEAARLAAFLTSQGFEVTPFTGTTAAAWAGAFSQADAVVIPKLANYRAPGVINRAMAAEINAWVASGKGLITLGGGWVSGLSETTGANGSKFLNDLFAWHLESTDLDSVPGQMEQESSVIRGLEHSPTILEVLQGASGHNGTYSIPEGTLPPGAEVLYRLQSNTERIGAFRFGRVYHLAWDWATSTTPSNEAAWEQVLSLAARHACGELQDEPGNLDHAETLPANGFGDAVLTKAGDQDLWRMEVPEGGTLIAWSTGPTDVIGEILDAVGNVIAIKDDAIGLNFQVSAQVTAGVYYLRVRGFGSSVGPYTVRYRHLPAETPWHLTALAPEPGNTGMRVGFLTALGNTYTLQYSDNLAVWTTLNSIAGTGREVFSTMATQGKYTRRYFRVISSSGSVSQASSVVTQLVTVAQNGTATLALPALPSSVKGWTYQWTKDGSSLFDSPTISGSQTRTLRIKYATNPGDEGNYVCILRDNFGAVKAEARMQLIVAGKPELVQQEYPASAVGAAFKYRIGVTSLDSSQAPTRYVITGLPRGLRYDPVLGYISGVPTVSGTFNITITAVDAAGKTAVYRTKLVVAPINPLNVGAYVAAIDRGTLNDNLGGRLDLTTTKAGSYSGKLTLGGLVYSFRGALNNDGQLDYPATASSGVVTIARRSPWRAVALTFSLDPVTNGIVGSVEDAVTGAVSAEGWRNTWSSLNPATSFTGYHTFATMLDAPELGEMSLPQGSSFGAVTVNAKTGIASIAGGVADDVSTAALTSSAALGPNGEVLLFHTRYPGKSGSLRSVFAIEADTHIITGSGDWAKGSQALSHRTYTDGYFEFPFRVVGGQFVPLVSPNYMLGLSQSTPFGAVHFNYGFIETSTFSPDRAFTVVPPAKVSLPTLASGSNPTATTLAVNPRTGTFSGRFSVIPVLRTANYRGILVRDADGEQRGYGYFLLANPFVSGYTPSTYRIYSGQVEVSRP